MERPRGPGEEERLPPGLAREEVVIQARVQQRATAMAVVKAQVAVVKVEGQTTEAVEMAVGRVAVAREVVGTEHQRARTPP